MLKICVIGSSGHFRYALEGLDEECSVTGIAPGVPEEDLSKLEKAISEMNIKPKKYNNWWEMLEKEKPDILVINTVFSLNGKILLEALERKIHAFVEKPIATTFEDQVCLSEGEERGFLHSHVWYQIPATFSHRQKTCQ